MPLSGRRDIFVESLQLSSARFHHQNESRPGIRSISSGWKNNLLSLQISCCPSKLQLTRLQQRVKRLKSFSAFCGQNLTTRLSKGCQYHRPSQFRTVSILATKHIHDGCSKLGRLFCCRQLALFGLKSAVLLFPRYHIFQSSSKISHSVRVLILKMMKIEKQNCQIISTSKT